MSSRMLTIITISCWACLPAHAQEALRKRKLAQEIFTINTAGEMKERETHHSLGTEQMLQHTTTTCPPPTPPLSIPVLLQAGQAMYRWVGVGGGAFLSFLATSLPLPLSPVLELVNVCYYSNCLPCLQKLILRPPLHVRNVFIFVSCYNTLRVYSIYITYLCQQLQ